MRTAYAIGLDVGGTRIAAGLVERKGRIVRETKVLTPKASGPFAIVDAVVDAIAEVTQNVHPSEIAGIGIGLPAQIDFTKQTVEFCTNLPLGGVDMRGLVTSRAKFPVTIDNDGHTAAIAEWRFGAAKGLKDFVMVTLGTGVGGGVFVDGRPYRGFRGFGGEIGHMVVQLDGELCPCGGRGHLEAYAARPAIIRDALAAVKTFRGSGIRRLANDVPEKITAEVVIQAARSGDEAAIEIMNRVGDVLGEAMVGLVNLLNPQAIIVGGGIGESSPLVIERASARIQSEALAGRRDVRVLPAELGNDAGLVGAAALAFDEHDSREGMHR
ncbi:MAG: ROK family protein [Coriobacteriia bacterium]|nr:ROK family protein [Coriobacteriia bacterium]